MNEYWSALPTYFLLFLVSSSFLDVIICRLFCDTVIGEVYTRSPARYMGRWRVAKEGGGVFFKKRSRKKKKKR